METKHCSSCFKEKPIEHFAFQKRNPGKRYAWCNPCRRGGGIKNLKSYKKEVEIMRKKTMDLRRFTPEEDLEIRKEYQRGGTAKDMAKARNVSLSTVYGSLRRTKSNHGTL